MNGRKASTGDSCNLLKKSLTWCLFHRLKMLIPQWTFLAVVSVSILWESESCSIEDFPLLPPNYGNYVGRNFNLLASTVYRSRKCFDSQITFDSYYGSVYKLVVEDLSPGKGCNLHDLRKRLNDGNLTEEYSCYCENVYERDSWVLYMLLKPPN